MTCQLCGAEFSGRYNQKYCSKECAKHVARRQKTEYARVSRAEAAKLKANQEILRISELARKKKMSYGEYVHKYEPRKEPKKEVKPVESICDTCPVKKCNKGVNSCNRWARDFAIKWRKIQRRAGVHVDRAGTQCGA